MTHRAHYAFTGEGEGGRERREVLCGGRDREREREKEREEIIYRGNGQKKERDF